MTRVRCIDQTSLPQTVLAFVHEQCKRQQLPYAPEMLVNGRPGFAGEEAEDLIHAAADSIGLARTEVGRAFPYGTYFEPEVSLSLRPFLMVKRLSRRPPTYRPLTAQGFAESMVSLKQSTRPTS